MFNIKNKKATIWILINVIVGSFLALILELSETKNYPFLFTALHNIFALLFFLIIIKIFQPNLFSYKVINSIFSPFSKNKKSHIILIPCIISSITTFPLFLIATQYINILVAIIIYETWPIFMILLTEKLFYRSNRFIKNTLKLIPLFLIATIGLSLIIHSYFPNTITEFPIEKTTLLGISLALLSAFTNALSPAFSIKHGAILHKNILNKTKQFIDEIFCTMISLSIQRLIAGIFTLSLALYIRENITAKGLIAGLITGVFITGIGNIAIRKANLTTNNLGINILIYTKPIFAITWLWIFTKTKVIHPDLLIIGTITIIITNILFSLRNLLKISYKILIILPWILFVSIYLYY